MIVRFNEYDIDIDRRELRRLGESVHVEPQVFDLLLLLIDNRERVVTKDEIIAEIWDGRAVSEAAISSRINAARRALGDSGETQSCIRTVPRRGFRFIAVVEVADSVSTDTGGGDGPAPSPPEIRQRVSFCKTADGVNLAVAVAGEGKTVVKAGNWLTHVEHDWNSPIWASLNQTLASHFRFVRFDGRGYGLSDWDVETLGIEASVQDLETVVDAHGLERISLLGISQGAAAAVTYAARHPERVDKMVIHGGYARGRKRRNSRKQEEDADLFLALMSHGWGDEHSAFMRAFSSIFLPRGTAEQISWFTELQNLTASAQNAVRLRQANDIVEVSELLPQVQAETLVLHSRYDAVVPLQEGRLLATSIPRARFVELESDNHLILPQEPAWPKFIAEMVGFLG